MRLPRPKPATRPPSRLCGSSRVTDGSISTHQRWWWTMADNQPNRPLRCSNNRSPTCRSSPFVPSMQASRATAVSSSSYLPSSARILTYPPWPETSSRQPTPARTGFSCPLLPFQLRCPTVTRRPTPTSSTPDSPTVSRSRSVARKRSCQHRFLRPQPPSPGGTANGTSRSNSAELTLNSPACSQKSARRAARLHSTSSLQRPRTDHRPSSSSPALREPSVVIPHRHDGSNKHSPPNSMLPHCSTRTSRANLEPNGPRSWRSPSSSGRSPPNTPQGRTA